MQQTSLYPVSACQAGYLLEDWPKRIRHSTFALKSQTKHTLSIKILDQSTVLLLIRGDLNGIFFKWHSLLPVRALWEYLKEDKLGDYFTFLLCPNLKISSGWQRKPQSGSCGEKRDVGRLLLRSHVLTWSHFLCAGNRIHKLLCTGIKLTCW